MRNFGILLVILLWLVLGWKMCTDYKECCPGDEIAAEEVPAIVPVAEAPAVCEEGIICFADSSCEPIFGTRFEAFRDSLTNLVSSDKILRITGVYNTSEEYDGTSSNLGTCRAEALRSSFASLGADQINISGQLTVGRTVQRGERYSFDIISNDNNAVSAQALIYFPYNSTNKLNDSDIESYLNDVAERVKNSGEKVKLTGHTDDKGRAVKNMELGQRRANIIADYLMGQGVLRSQIIAESQGESQPAASNSTEVGRARNRRTELQIIK